MRSGGASAAPPHPRSGLPGFNRARPGQPGPPGPTRAHPPGDEAPPPSAPPRPGRRHLFLPYSRLFLYSEHIAACMFVCIEYVCILFSAQHGPSFCTSH